MPRAYAPSRTGSSQSKLEGPIVRFPRGPHRFAHAYDRDVRLRHEVQVDIKAFVRPILEVIGGSEKDAIGRSRHVSGPSF